ncbi:MAG: hypothetical protein ACYC0X_05190 [Pirellulaceae bacterium]
MRKKTRAVVTCVLWMAGLYSVPSGLAAAAPANEAPTSSGIVLGIEGSAFTINGKKTFLLGASYYGALAAPDDFIALPAVSTAETCRRSATWRSLCTPRTGRPSLARGQGVAKRRPQPLVTFRAKIIALEGRQRRCGFLCPENAAHIFIHRALFVFQHE